MALLTPSDVHIDQPLTNLTLSWMQSQQNFVAHQVFPNVSVQKQSDKFYKYDPANSIRSGDRGKLAPRTEASRIEMVVSNDSYYADVFGLGMDFGQQELANQDTVLQVRSSGAEVLLMRMMIDKELDWTNTFMATGVWGTDYTGVAGAPGASQIRQWNDYTNSTPIVDMTALAKTVQLTSGGFKPNTMVCGIDVYTQLVNNPDIIARLNGGATVTNTALVVKAKLAEIFGVEKFLVMEAVYNSAKEGLTAVNTFVGAKDVLLCYTPTTAGLKTPAAGLTFTWDAIPGVSANGLTVESFKDDALKRLQIEENIVVKQAYDMKVVGPDLGLFINDAVA